MRVSHTAFSFVNFEDDFLLINVHDLLTGNAHAGSVKRGPPLETITIFKGIVDPQQDCLLGCLLVSGLRIKIL